MRKNRLQRCDRCKEDSVVVKCYGEEGKRKRVAVCMNNGCGWKMEMPFMEEELCKSSQ